MKKAVLNNFGKFAQEKAPMANSLVNKVAGFRPATLLKKRLRYRCFHVGFTKFLKKLLRG